MPAPQGGCEPDPQLRPQVGLLRPAELLVDSMARDLGSVCKGRLVCLMSMSRCDVRCDAPVSPKASRWCLGCYVETHVIMVRSWPQDAALAEPGRRTART